MTREEYMKCKAAAKLYHDKFEECEMLKRRNDQLARENRLLKERLGYRRLVDIQHSKDDAEVFLIVKMNHVRRYMKITEVVVFTKGELARMINGQTYAYVNPGDNKEILVMSDEKYEEWQKSDFNGEDL